jgi:hypothetical protein
LVARSGGWHATERIDRDRLADLGFDTRHGGFYPRVLVTPHISSSTDQDRHGAINLFCDISTADHCGMSLIGNGAIRNQPAD